MNDTQDKEAEKRRSTGADDSPGLYRDQVLVTLTRALRGRLAAVANSAEVLCRHGIPSDVREEAVKTILEQIGLIQQLIDNLSEPRELVRGDHGARRMLTDVTKAARMAIDASRPLINRYGHTLDVALPRGPLHAEGDDATLARILTNLLINAARYTPDGGRIRLLLELEEDAVVIRVTDNGIGIPKAMLLQVFDLFTRLERAKQRHPEGMGIGLALVRQLVEDQGGTVHALSNGDGQGSEFVVRLPLAEDTRLRQTRLGAGQKLRNRRTLGREPHDTTVAWAWG